MRFSQILWGPLGPFGILWDPVGPPRGGIKVGVQQESCSNHKQKYFKKNKFHSSQNYFVQKKIKKKRDTHTHTHTEPSYYI